MAEQYKHKFSAIVLAAGKGTRMGSDTPKVMHSVAGKPLIAHVLAALKPLSPEKTVVVIAPKMDEVKEAATEAYKNCQFAVQEKRQGTGHATQCAEPALGKYSGTVLIVYGDTPLITSATLSRALTAAESAEIVVIGMRLADPTGYGRLVVDGNGQLEEIVEDRDAKQQQKKIGLCNSGIMAVSGKHLFTLLKSLTANNAAGEYYLTDIVSAADEHNLHCHVVEADPAEMLGVNTRSQLADSEYLMQQRLRAAALEQGVTLIAPETIYFQADTVIGQDALIHPYVVFGPGVTIENGAEIRSFSHIAGARVKKGAVIGPFARLRPGAVIGEDAHVGNFVEIKKSTLGKGAKANHLSYIGDAEVGEGANIGAGTITCNYDGKEKHKTMIGANAFIGSNTALVAPVTVGGGAIIGAGSVVTQDVPPYALAIARGQQVNKPDKAKKLKK